METTELIERVTVHSLADIRRAAVALYEAILEREFRVAVCADISSRNPLVDADGIDLNATLFGKDLTGRRWWEHSQLALQSPIPRACRYESEAFWCNKHGIFTRWSNKYLAAIDLSDFSERALCDTSIVVPIHLPFARIGAVSFRPLDQEIIDLSADFAAYADLFAQLARRFVASYVSAMLGNQRMPTDSHLSKREVECLKYAAIGKTDTEVGMILSLSHATVRYHMARASEKLNAVNRTQTILKAGQLGYLGASTQ